MRFALIAALSASPAMADFPVPVGQPMPRMSLEAGNPPCFAVIVIENRAGVYNQTETLDTEAGPVLVRYETVGGHNANDHDLVAVVDLPPNVAAQPMEMELPDGDTGRVCLMEMVGM